MYLRALPHDDDVERREESSQDGAQIPHKIVAFGAVHLEEKRNGWRTRSDPRFFNSLFKINMILIFLDCMNLISSLPQAFEETDMIPLRCNEIYSTVLIFVDNFV